MKAHYWECRDQARCLTSYTFWLRAYLKRSDYVLYRAISHRLISQILSVLVLGDPRSQRKSAISIPLDVGFSACTIDLS